MNQNAPDFQDSIKKANDAARSFAEIYISAFANDPKQLASLYGNNSILTYGGNSFCGVGEILEKLTNLGLGKLSVMIDTIDGQPLSDAFLFVATGHLQVEGQEYPLKFTWAWVVIQQPNNTPLILSEILRVG